jgi:signal transduction histidine kinase/HAMP domain-containing protein
VPEDSYNTGDASRGITTRGGWKPGVRARLLLAFFGISGFSILAAAAGIYAFREVGDRLELIDARVPQVVTSMEISRAADRLIASAPALLAASTTKERDEVSNRMRPEIDRLIVGLVDIGRAGTAGDAAISIQLLVASLRSNLAELQNLVGLRLKTRERLAGLLQAAFQANQEAGRLFAPWLQVMEMQINRSLDEARKPNVESGAQAGRDLATSIVLDRSAQAAQRGFSAVVDQLVQTATSAEKLRLPVVEFQLRRSLDDLDAKAKDLDPKLRALFIDLLGRVRALAIGPDAMLAVRGQELDLVGNAEKLIAENTDVTVRLTAAIDRLAAEAETDVSSSTRSALSVQRLSARILLTFAALSLVSSILIVWFYVSRNLIRRLMRLSSGMLAIAGGRHHSPIDIPGSDEVAEMGRVVEIFRKNTLERDELLAEKAQAAERLENEVKQRTAELAQSVEELRALGDVSQAVNSTIDLEMVLSTIVAKAVQLSGTEAGTIYVFDEVNQEFQLRASYGMDDALIAAVKGQHIRMGETVVSRAVMQRSPMQIYDLQHDSSSPVLDVILRAGFRAHLTIPLLGADRVIGALVVRRKQPGEFPKSTVDLLQTFGTQSVLAIQNARLFRELEEKSRELEIASKHKSQFLANMSHELRTPLNAILGYTELILDSVYGDTSEKMRGVLQRIESNGRHLLGLINDVLDLSKIEAGQLVLALADYSLKNVAHTVFSAVEPLAKEKRLAFKVEVGPDLPPGYGDERRLTQVLLNLVGNAIKFTDSGEVVIKASQENGSFHIAVCDTGPGISKADQAKLFQEFQQADNSITRKKGGTGLGLAISKRIVEMHGGKIWVDSIVGHGSTFSVTLPLKVEQQARPAQQEPSPAMQ